MKKPSMISFIITLLLAAAVCTHCKEQVKDTAGNPIQVGEQYFIQPVKTESNNGGGLVPAPTTILPPICPLGISQTLLSFQPGLPVTFASQDNIPDTIVETSSIINIEFQSNIDWPVCNEFSKLWAVDDASKDHVIIIGGEPGSGNSAFTIENAGEGAGANTYKLTTSTGTVGTIPGPWFGAPELVLTKDDATNTLLVKFKKVDGATTATTATSRIEKLGLRMFPFY